MGRGLRPGEAQGSRTSRRAGPELTKGGAPQGGAGNGAPRCSPRTAGTGEGRELEASPARGVLAAAGAAAAEQREQQAEEQGEQRARTHHTLSLVGLCGGHRVSEVPAAPAPPPGRPHPLTQAAGTGDRVARVLVAAAGLGAVHAVEPGRASQVTAAGARGQGGAWGLGEPSGPRLRLPPSPPRPASPGPAPGSPFSRDCSPPPPPAHPERSMFWQQMCALQWDGV